MFVLSTQCFLHGGEKPRGSVSARERNSMIVEWVDFHSAGSDVAGTSWSSLPGQSCCVFSKYEDGTLVILTSEKRHTLELF